MFLKHLNRAIAALAITVGATIGILAPSAQAQDLNLRNVLTPAQAAVAEAGALQEKGGIYVSTPARNGLRVTAWVDQKDLTYRPGEPIQIYVQTSKDAYVWMVNVGTSGRVSEIYPNAYSGGNFVRAGQVVAIPAPNADFRFEASGPAGVELVKVFASTAATPPYRSAGGAGNEPYRLLSDNAGSFAKDIVVATAPIPSTAVIGQVPSQSEWAVYNKVLWIDTTPPQVWYNDAGIEAALGLTREDRRRVQVALQKLNFNPGVADGIFGSRTRAAIRAFQAAYNLPQTGYLTYYTLGLLSEVV
ncbi:DUF4384 domain-containing protein [Oricola sp.]|uniref:DUF4384 domain-containing protein n=1 Tax=Oricola sp. TaxID=1979950 RepID=UPI002600CDC4|nr:DUF4384 domain-containing protein [Oricola sp.]MCI5078657.1 DUF4384 domain-containing protein [Oricola sp.]